MLDMALQDIMTNLGTAIINLVTKKIEKHNTEKEATLLELQEKFDGLIESGDEPSFGGTSSADLIDFVNNTSVDTLTTTSKTIVGSINEIDSTIGDN